MARRIPPSDGYLAMLESVSRPPAPKGDPPLPIGNPTAPKGNPPSAPSRAREAVVQQFLQRPSRYTATFVAITLAFAVLATVVMLLATRPVHAQGVCMAPLPAAAGTAGAAPPSQSTPGQAEGRGAVRRTAWQAIEARARLGRRANQCALAVLATGLVLGLWNRRRPVRADGGARAERKADPRVGAYSCTGNTRETNQDRVRVGRVAGLDVVDMADGMGGLPRGGEAAEIATAYAWNRLEAELPLVVVAKEEGVRALLLKVVWGAAAELACEAARRSWRGESGLRTTLVLVVASRDTYVAAWIGDGGAFVVRADGTVVPLVEPHKRADEPDVLEASLGPETHGRPGWAMAPRFHGDILVAATDGIADRFGPDVVDLVRQELDGASGDAACASRAVAETLAGKLDEGSGFAITDNLTIAVLTDGGAP